MWTAREIIVTFGGVGWDPHRTGSVLQGAGGCEATQAASARLTTGEPLPATLGQVAIEGIPATGGEDSHGCAPPKNCLRLRHYPELTPVFVSPSGLRLSGLAKRKAQPPREDNPNTICLPNTLNENLGDRTFLLSQKRHFYLAKKGGHFYFALTLILTCRFLTGYELQSNGNKWPAVA